MVQLFVCGDVSNHTHSEDFIDDSLGTIINEADYAVCNFEGPELAPNRSENYPHQGAGTAAYLSRMGFDLMLLANNHITEQGAEGIEYSIDKIQCAGSDYIGAGLTWEQAYRTLQKTIKGVKFCFINICEAQVGQFLSREQAYGYAWMGYDGLFDNIHKLSEDNDIVIIFVHAGLEHFVFPLPEIRDFYFKLCEAGASIVIGGHTHTAQGFEFHNESLIVYSLGNFFFPYPDGIRTQENTSYSVKINVDDQMHIAVSVIHHTTRDGRFFLLQDTSQQIEVDLNWNVLPYTKESYLLEPLPEKPECLEEMVKYAKILSEDFDFVRVDFYEYEGKVYFSELTFSPWGGYFYSYTDEALMELGKLYV